MWETLNYFINLLCTYNLTNIHYVLQVGADHTDHPSVTSQSSMRKRPRETQRPATPSRRQHRTRPLPPPPPPTAPPPPSQCSPIDSHDPTRTSHSHPKQDGQFTLRCDTSLQDHLYIAKKMLSLN